VNIKKIKPSHGHLWTFQTATSSMVSEKVTQNAKCIKLSIFDIKK